MKKGVIVICGLNDKLNIEVGKLLSGLLDMFFLSLKDLVEYEVWQEEEIVEKVSVQYLESLEEKAVKKASTFENTVVVAGYDLFSYKKNFNYFKPNSYIIYLRQIQPVLEKQQGVDKLNKLNFKVRDDFFKKVANYTLNLISSNKKTALKSVVTQLKEVYL